MKLRRYCILIILSIALTNSRRDTYNRGPKGATRGGVVLFPTSCQFDGLDAVVCRNRKIKGIATPLSRLAMTNKWDNGAGELFFVFPVLDPGV